MITFELVLYILMIITGAALVLFSVNLIKIIKSNTEKKIEDIESSLNKNITAIGVLTVAVAVLFLIDIIIR